MRAGCALRLCAWYLLTRSASRLADRLPRGTRITLHLKEDCEELTDATKLASLVKTYSEFISFPIEVRGLLRRLRRLRALTARPGGAGVEQLD